MITTILLSVLLIDVFAPEFPIDFTNLMPATPEPVVEAWQDVYEPLIKAIVFVESTNGLDTINDIENAIGWFQIRQIRVDDYNKRTGSSYELNDFFDYHLSKEMFLYYAQGKSFEQAAKNWNGSGPMTEVYWKKVKKRL